jgi:hypothetical protein
MHWNDPEPLLFDEHGSDTWSKVEAFASIVAADRDGLVDTNPEDHWQPHGDFVVLEDWAYTKLLKWRFSSERGEYYGEIGWDGTAIYQPDDQEPSPASVAGSLQVFVKRDAKFNVKEIQMTDGVLVDLGY